MKRKILISMFIFSMSTAAAIAQTNTSTSTNISTTQPGFLETVTLSLDLSQSSNRFSEDQAEAERSTDLEINLSKELATKDKVSVTSAVSRSNTSFQDTTLANTVVAYTFKPVQLDRDNSATYSVRAILPTNEESNEDSSFQAAASARALLTSKKQMLGKPVTVNTFVDALKNQHQFETNADGEGNLNYRVRIYGGATLSLTEKLSLGVEGYYQAGHTYQNALKANFLMSEKIAFTPEKDGASFYLAHTNDGNALGPNGEDSNIKAFESSSSVLSAGVSASF